MIKKFLSIKAIYIAMAIVATIGCNSTEQQNAQTTQNTQKTSTEQQSNKTEKEQFDQAVERAEQQEKQNNDPKQEPVSPDEIMKNYAAPQELKYCTQSDDFLYSKFYPIGWSKDGHFAYIIEPADEAAGLYFFEFVVQNMISDKIVYSWKPDEELEEGSVKRMWKSYTMMFAEKLNKYGIVQQENFKLENIEFSYNNDKFKVTIKNQLEMSPDFGFEVVKGTQIDLKSQNLGQKRIYSKQEKDFSAILSRKIAGIIKSPFENRVAVIVQSETCGYEGPPNVVSTFLVGANLTETFKKQ